MTVINKLKVRTYKDRNNLIKFIELSFGVSYFLNSMGTSPQKLSDGVS